MIWLFACTGALPGESAEPEDSGRSTPAACASIIGVETDGDYTDCYAVGSEGFYNFGGDGIEGCTGCAWSVFVYVDPAGGADCAAGEADVSVSDDAFAEFADGGTAGYAGGGMGSCTVLTESWAADDDNSHAWKGSLVAELILLDTFGEEVGQRSIELSADIADPG